MTATNTAALSANPLEPITVTLDPRLVAELPRFFGGFGPMLAELFQNAYRAGAQHVTITSAGRKIVFSDDGHGIASPEILFRAGATGWNEREVIAPAGLGVFSFLNPSVVSELTIRSRNWEINTTPQAALALEPIKPRPAPDIAGTEVNLLLQAPQNDPSALKHALECARSLYPFNVTWNNQPLEAQVHPRDQRLSVTVTLPEGEVSLSSRRFTIDRQYTHHSGVIWQHRVIKAEFSGVAQNPLEEAIAQSYIMFTPNASCDVRPKLPDRNCIEDSPDWSAAKSAVVRGLKLELIARATRAMPSWPEEFTLEHIATGELEGVGEGILGALLLNLGFAGCLTQTTDLSEMYDNFDNQGVQFGDTRVTYYSKNALIVSDPRAELVGNALIELNEPSPTTPQQAPNGAPRPRYSYHPSGQQVTVSDEHHLEETDEAYPDAPADGWLAIASSIALENGSTLPCLIDPSGGTSIIAGDLKTAWQTLHGPLRDELIAAAVRHQCWNGNTSVHELAWFDDRDLDPDNVMTMLEQQLLELHGVDSAATYDEIINLEDSLGRLASASSLLGTVAHRYAVAHPQAVSSSVDGLTALRCELEAALETLRRRVDPLQPSTLE